LIHGIGRSRGPAHRPAPKASWDDAEDLADALSVSHQAVSKWERGESLPDVATLVPLATVLGISVDELLRGAVGTVPEMEAPVPSAPLPQVTRRFERARQFLGWSAPPPQDPLHPSLSGPDPGLRLGPPAVTDVVGLAPFLPSSALSDLIEETTAPWTWEDVLGVAPFLEEPLLVRLLGRVNPDCPPVSVIAALAPFLPGDVLEELMGNADPTGWDWPALKQLAPFLDPETMAQMVSRQKRGASLRP
jgi:transcriptional regulator with XRE-family HTH domain